MFALARTLRKTIKNLSERSSRASYATDRSRNALFSSLGASKWSPRAPRSALRGVLGPSWTLLGRSWDPLGRSWGALGPSWGALGALLARSSSLPHPKIRREKLRRAISDDFGSILVDFPDKNLRDPSENLRNPAENLPPSAVPRTPKNQLGCGGRAKRIQ